MSFPVMFILFILSFILQVPFFYLLLLLLSMWLELKSLILRDTVLSQYIYIF